MKSLKIPKGVIRIRISKKNRQQFSDVEKTLLAELLENSSEGFKCQNYPFKFVPN
jgi:hypothetical protein